MKIVGMKQLRQKFDPIKKGLEKGEEYLLMYRSKPLAVLRPYQANEDSQYLQRPRVTNQNPHQAPQVSPIAPPISPAIQPTLSVISPREIPAPKMTYGDVINGYKTRKANGGGISPTSTPAPSPAPILKNPLSRLGLRRAFI